MQPYDSLEYNFSTATTMPLSSLRTRARALKSVDEREITGKSRILKPKAHLFTLSYQTKYIKRHGR